MAPINPAIIEDKLFRLNEYARFIDDVLKKPNEEILANKPLYYGLQHMLQISIEIIIDAGSHILAEEFSVNPKTYADVIVALGDKKVIDKKFAEEQAGMAGFRNMLVHDYDNVDEKRVIEYGRTASSVFRLFGKAFIDFLDKKHVRK